MKDYESLSARNSCTVSCCMPRFDNGLKSFMTHVRCPGIFPSSFVLRAATAKGGSRQLRGRGSKNLDEGTTDTSTSSIAPLLNPVSGLCTLKKIWLQSLSPGVPVNRHKVGGRDHSERPRINQRICQRAMRPSMLMGAHEHSFNYL